MEQQRDPLELNFTITNNSSSNQVCSLYGANFTLIQPKSVLSNITGSKPFTMAFNPLSNTMYVTVPTANSVSVINCYTNTVVSSIACGTAPRYVAYNSYNNTMYVSCFTSQNVKIIDCTSNTVVNTIAIGKSIQGIAYNITNNTMYVCSSSADDITVIDCSNDSIIATIASTGTSTIGIAYNQQMNRMYASNFTSGDVSVIDCDTNSVISLISISALSAPAALATNTLNNTVYVALSGIDSVSIIDSYSNTILSSISVGSTPSGITYDRANNNMYVNNNMSDNCMIINCAYNTILSTVSLGSGPLGIAFNTINNNAYSAIQNDSIVSVIGDAVSIVPSYNVPYAQVLRDSSTHPFTVGQIRMFSTNVSQVQQNLSILSTNIYGNIRQEPLPMEGEVSEYQFQPGIARTTQEFNVTGNVGFSFTILPLTTVICTVSIKKIMRMPTRFDSSIIREYPILELSSPINF